MCGVLGILGRRAVVHDLIFGLNCLQHRGQDAAGIVTFSDRFHLRKDRGLVNSVFGEEDVAFLRGNAGLGHVRYATQGSTGIVDAQPFYMNYPFGIAMIHNGNVINFSEMAQTVRQGHRLVETSNDLELLLYSLAACLERKNLDTVAVEEIFDCVMNTQTLAKGAYAVVSFVASKGLLAFTDIHGIRPLILGRRITSMGPEHAFASESTVLESLGFDVVRQLSAGEIVLIDHNHEIHCSKPAVKRSSFCLFEYIYFAREDTVFYGNLVAEMRSRMGRLLARKFRERNLVPDVVIDVPSSSYFFAEALAEELSVPYRRGFSINKYVGRSFIKSSDEDRTAAVRLKLKPMKPYIEGRTVAVVDDSIVRGTTSRRIVQLLRESGALAIYFVSAAPPVQHPCVYGIDMSMAAELVAAEKSHEEVAEAIGADAVIYQDLADVLEIFPANSLCAACFSGNYPTDVSTEILRDIAQDKCKKRGG